MKRFVAFDRTPNTEFSMNLKVEWKKQAGIVGVFLLCFYLPVGRERFDGAVLEAFALVK